MQPLLWDSTSRAPAADSVSLFAGSDALRQPAAESFGAHLQRPDAEPTTATIPPATIPPATASRASAPKAETARPEAARPETARPETARPESHSDRPAQPSAAPAPSAQAESAQSSADDPAAPPEETADVAGDGTDDPNVAENAAILGDVALDLVPAQSQGQKNPAATEPSTNPISNRDLKIPAGWRSKNPTRQHAAASEGNERQPDPKLLDPEVEAPRAAEKKKTVLPGAKARAAENRKQHSPPRDLPMQTDQGDRSARTEPVVAGKQATALETGPETESDLEPHPATSISAAKEIENPLTISSARQLVTESDEQKLRQKRAETASQLRIPETVAVDGAQQVAHFEAERGNPSRQQARVLSSGAAIEEAITPLDLPASERARETPLSASPLPASIAQEELPIDTAAVESGSGPAPTAENSPTTIQPQLRFMQHLAAKPGERTAKTHPLTDLEQARLVERVARAFQAAEDRGGTVTLRLHPPELGVLRVEMRVMEGVLSARLEAETPAARSALLDNVHVLHERLAEQGVRVERFDVDLLDRRPSGDAPAFEHNRPRGQENRDQPVHDSGNHERSEPDAVRASSRPATPGQLNVVV